MYINPFWFGFLIGIIITVVVLAVVASAMNSGKVSRWEEEQKYEENDKRDQ